MTKKTIEVLLQVLDGLITDTSRITGLDLDPLLGDFSKISVTSKSRGLDVLSISLPAICNDFERSLDIGKYERSYNGPLSALAGNTPDLFSTLYGRVFGSDGILVDEPCVDSIRCLRQLLLFAKKVDVECSQERISDSVTKFISIEDELPEPILGWGNICLFGSNPRHDIISCAYDHYESSRCSGTEVSSEPGKWDHLTGDLSAIFRLAGRTICKWRLPNSFKPKHGPGAVSETYVSSKYEFPSWNPRLEQFFPFSEYGCYSYTDIGQLSDPISDDDPSAKLIAVPKTQKGPRLIASEPIASQYMQQALLKCFRSWVSQCWLSQCIDFKSQEPSRELTLTASEDRSFSTIDLSSASDRLSCRLVETIFGSNRPLLEHLNAARTPTLRIENDLMPNGSGEMTIWQRKFAAQGAAFTFPVQTVIYTLIAAGVCSRVFNTTPEDARIGEMPRVYGDDIIVPSLAFHRTCSALEALGLRVNNLKSFHNGNFRESCGMDAFGGHDVTPGYVRRTYDAGDLNTVESIVECTNNFYKKGFVEASYKLQMTLPKSIRRLIVGKPIESNVFGFIAPMSTVKKTRWNPELQILEARILRVETKVKKSKPDGNLSLFQWFIELPGPETHWVPGVVKIVKPRIRLRWVPVRDIG